MPEKIFGPRKRRTREHVLADLSVHYVEGFILEEGHTAQRLGSDSGYDLVLFTYGEHGYIEPGSLFIQLKAAKSLRAARGRLSHGGLGRSSATAFRHRTG